MEDDVSIGMRKGLTAYGDPEFSLFLRKAFIRAMGYSDEALERPIVGIADTGSDYNPCHGTAPQIVEAVKRGVLGAGGLPMVFPTVSLHESFAYPTSMYLRNLMAMDTEEMLRAQPMDAVVAIGGCDKTIPAQLMAIASVDLPAIVVPVGPMLTTTHDGERLGACTDCRRLWAQYRAGTIDAAAIGAVTGRLAPTAGTCMVMGTASTMAAVTETLGLTLPGGAAIPAVHGERYRQAEISGMRAVALAREGTKASRFLTRASFRNAFRVLHCLGGSTNAVIHLTAVARRCGIEVDLDEFDALGEATPVLVNLKPAGEHYMEHLHEAGGIPVLLREIADLLDTSTPNVSGQTLAEIVAGAVEAKGQTAIRRRANPVYAKGGLRVLRGNLAPGGALIKESAATPALLRHEGRAVVFESVEDVVNRIDDPALDIRADDVIVMRNAGPKGHPGMPEAGYVPIPRKLAREGVKDMVRISDARMSGTAFGTIVLHVTPEAMVGGPLALVETGDRIVLDVPARRIDLLVDEATLAARRARLVPYAVPEEARGYERLLLETIEQADRGCDFGFMAPRKITRGF
jgi:dihydroxy-acid dehydratase